MLNSGQEDLMKNMEGLSWDWVFLSVTNQPCIWKTILLKGKVSAKDPQDQVLSTKSSTYPRGTKGWE